MPTTRLPDSKEKAHAIAQKITNERPSRRDKYAPDGNVSGGFNQKAKQQEREEESLNDASAAEGDGQ